MDSEKILNKFTHVLHRIDNNILAKALHYCEHFNYTCCLQFMNTFTAHKMSSLILKFILHLDENGFTKVCEHLTDHPEDITELYYGKLFIDGALSLHIAIVTKILYQLYNHSKRRDIHYV